REEVKKLKDRSAMYSVIKIVNIDPVTYSVVKNGGINMKGIIKCDYDEDVLKKIFSACIDEIKEDEPCYILYDFVFFDKGLWKNAFCMISFIPESLHIFKKVAYSTNALRVIDEVGILFIFLLHPKKT
ncbi:actin-binding protein of the ADF family, partial [Nosema bombycis CQ1]